MSFLTYAQMGIALLFGFAQKVSWRIWARLAYVVTFWNAMLFCFQVAFLLCDDCNSNERKRKVLSILKDKKIEMR